MKKVKLIRRQGEGRAYHLGTFDTRVEAVGVMEALIASGCYKEEDFKFVVDRRPQCGDRDDEGVCRRCGSGWDGICGEHQR